MYSKFNLQGLYEQSAVDADALMNQETTPESTSEPIENQAEPVKTKKESFLFSAPLNADRVKKLRDLISSGKGLVVFDDAPLSIPGAENIAGTLNELPVYLMVRVASKNDRAAGEVQLTKPDRTYVLLDTKAEELGRWLDAETSADQPIRAAVKSAKGNRSIDLFTTGESQAPSTSTDASPAESEPSKDQVEDVKTHQDQLAAVEGVAAVEESTNYPIFERVYKGGDSAKVYSDLKNNPTAKVIGQVLIDAKNALPPLKGGDMEAWVEAAFAAIKDYNQYKEIETFLGKDPLAYVKGYMYDSEFDDKHHTGPKIRQSYQRILATKGALESKKKADDAKKEENRKFAEETGNIGNFAGTNWKTDRAETKGYVYAGNMVIWKNRVSYTDSNGEWHKANIVSGDWKNPSTVEVYDPISKKGMSADEFINKYKNWGTKSDTKPTTSPSTGFDEAQGNEFRAWANSTDELKNKYGKSSKFDLDASGKPDNAYIRKAYAAAKEEYDKYLASKGKEETLPWNVGDTVYFREPESNKGTGANKPEGESVADAGRMETTYGVKAIDNTKNESIIPNFDMYLAVTEQDNISIDEFMAALVKDFKDDKIRVGKVTKVISKDKVMVADKSGNEVELSADMIIDTDKAKEAKSKADELKKKEEEDAANKNTVEKTAGEEAEDKFYKEKEKKLTAKQEFKKKKKDLKTKKKFTKKSERQEKKTKKWEKKAEQLGESKVWTFDEFIKANKDLS